MLATFVIGLREGLEASLIVGIIAAFLRTNGTGRDVRRMWLGVGAAVALCIAVGIGLQVLSDGLPQREQEMLECVIAAVAVVMVTFMILWMRTHARALKRELESSASSALARGSAWALIAMAFLAVLREGFETSVFLLAALQNSSSGALPLLGATLGIIVAVGIGWLIYRGALRFNMSAFFTVTSVLLVFVAGGLVMKVFRAAFEAGWLGIGQQVAFDLSGLLPRGSVTEAIFGGVFGLNPYPALIEILAWTLYVVPMLLVVLWPRGRTLSAPRAARTLLATAAAAVVVAVIGIIAAPAAQASGPQQVSATASTDGGASEQTQVEIVVTAATAEKLTATIDGTTVELPAIDKVSVGDVGKATVYRLVTDDSDLPTDLPKTLSGAEIKQARGGRFPVGILPNEEATYPAQYAHELTTTIWLEPTTTTVVGYRSEDSIVATVTGSTGSLIQVGAVRTDSTVSEDDPEAMTPAVNAAIDQRNQSEVWSQVVPGLLITFAVILAGLGGWIQLSARRKSAS